MRLPRKSRFVSTGRVETIPEEEWGNPITKREKMFLENFLMTKTGDRWVDNLNFLRDLDLYKYPHRAELKRLFKELYDKSIEDVEKKLKEVVE